MKCRLDSRLERRSHNPIGRLPVGGPGRVSESGGLAAAASRISESGWPAAAVSSSKHPHLTPHPSQAAKRPTSHAARQRGFTLIEILAAFVVFALAFGAVMQALSGSVRNTVQSRSYTQAALMARSHMDSLGMVEELEPGTYSGELEEGYRYEMEIREWQPPEGIGPDGNIQARVEIYRVDLSVRWGEEPRVRQAEFSTLRTVAPEQ